MNTLIIRNSLYNTTNIIGEYIKEQREVDVIDLESVKHCDFEQYENIVIISSIYKGKPIFNSKEAIKRIFTKIKDKNIYLCYCSGAENYDYLTKCYDESIIDISKNQYWFGHSLDVNRLSFSHKIMLKIMKRANNNNEINYENIDSLINEIY